MDKTKSVPAQQLIEHWVTDYVVEKNNKTRLDVEEKRCKVERENKTN